MRAFPRIAEVSSESFLVELELTPVAEREDELNDGVNAGTPPPIPSESSVAPNMPKPTWNLDKLNNVSQHRAPVTVNRVQIPEPTARLQEDVLAEARGQKTKGRSFGHRAKTDKAKAQEVVQTTDAPSPDPDVQQVSPMSESYKRDHQKRQADREAGFDVPPSPALSEDSFRPAQANWPVEEQRPRQRQPSVKESRRDRSEGGSNNSRRPETDSSQPDKERERRQRETQEDSAFSHTRRPEPTRPRPNAKSDSESSPQGQKSQVQRYPRHNGTRDLQQQPSISQDDRPTYPPSSRAQEPLGPEKDLAQKSRIWAMVKVSPFWTLFALSLVTVYILGARQLFALAQTLSPSLPDVARKRQEPPTADSSGATEWISHNTPWLDGTGLFALINIWHVVFLTVLMAVVMVVQDNAAHADGTTETIQTPWQRMAAAPKSVWKYIWKAGSACRLGSFSSVFKGLAILLSIGAFAACLLYLDFLVSKLASVSSTVAESEQTGVAALVLLNVVFLVFVPLLALEFVLCLRAYLTWYRCKKRAGCGGNSGSDAWACACIGCPC